MSLKISPSQSLPREAVTWVLAFLAKRGAGKTYSSSVLAEEMLKANIPIVVIDGMGIWWGLRVSKDGKSNGLPIVVFGGEHQDLPLVPDKAPQMARAIVESNISCVLDLSGFSKSQMKKIVPAFLDELYKINRMERHVFMEEADMFAPQRTIGPEDAICQGAVQSFVRRGGNHNLGVTVITQRSAVLSKDVLTQADCLVILRTLAPQDKKAIQLWVEEMTDKDKTALAKWYDSLKELENGQAWIWHPEAPEIYKKVHFRERETFHATREFIRTPQAGNIKLMDVDDFIAKFKAVFEPKPKLVQEAPIAKQAGAPVPNRIEVSQEIASSSWDKPPVATGKPPGPQIIQALPNLEIQQFKPTLGLSVEMLDQPTTPLGRVAVVLNNDPNNPAKWSKKRIEKDIQDHGWDAGDIGDAVNQLMRWEILTKDGYGGMLKVHRSRIKVLDSQGTLAVQ